MKSNEIETYSRIVFLLLIEEAESFTDIMLTSGS